LAVRLAGYDDSCEIVVGAQLYTVFMLAAPEDMVIASMAVLVSRLSR